MVISAQNVSVAVPVERKVKLLIEHLSFALPASQFVAIIGASGSGKSTLVQTLAGARSPCTGKVFLSGHPVQKLREHFPLAISYLPQFGAFQPELTVVENLRDALALRLPGSVSGEVRKAWLARIIEVSISFRLVAVGGTFSEMEKSA